MPEIFKRPTIKNVAKLAGVSTAVVSYVLNNTPGKTLPDQTRVKVREAARMLHYIPNNAARSMRSEKSMLIGLVTFWETDNSFFTGILRGILDKANELGYSVCICSNSRHSDSLDYLRLFLQNHVDAILFVAPLEKVPGYNESIHLNKIRDYMIPCVVINGLSYQPGVHSVHIDFVQIGYAATEYLVKRGHRNIVFAQSPDDTHRLTEMREQGYFQCLRDYDIPQMEKCVYRPGEIPDLMEQVASGDCKVTAMVANKSDIAHDILNIAYKKRMSIPEKLSVIAANTHAYSAFLFPALTTVSLPTYEIGSAAVRILTGRPAAGMDQFIDTALSCTVCERDSCQSIHP